MKRVLIAILLFCSVLAKSQSYSVIDRIGTIKVGAGYAQDFPGVAGLGISGEVTFQLMERFEGGIGFKRLSMQGYPRTESVQEFTKANTVDFNIYYLPVVNENSVLRVGLGYALSSYNIRRSFPVVNTGGIDKLTYPTKDEKGRTKGGSVIVEYEYFMPNSNFSFGVRGAWFKAYDRALYLGPFVGLSF
jgi:hypothetical protein